MVNTDLSSPYRGLDPYTEADAAYFFGRSSESATIAANLEVARLTVLYGPSGVGKSSVLRAGVIHLLQERSRENFIISGRPEIIPVYFNRWQSDPLQGLTHTIATTAQPFLHEQSKIQDTNYGLTLTNFLQIISDQTESELLLVFDQFEEYFLYHPNEREPGSFASMFVQAVNRSDLRANFLLSIREDALSRLDHFKGQIPFLLDNRLNIEYLRRDAGREAVIRPLGQYNIDNGTHYTIDPALVETVLDQVGRGKVALGKQGSSISEAEHGRLEVPYLQLVLTRLWEEENRHSSITLRQETLDSLGGAQKIVANYLDDTMSSLPVSYQAIAARFFDRLVTLGGTKIALSLEELVRYAKADSAEVQLVLQQLQIKRLLRGVQSPAGDTQYEIFHDVLAQAVLDWQSRVPWRTAEHYLDSGLLDWREARRSKEREFLLDRERYQYIWSQKAVFSSLTAEANEFLARSALYQGDDSFSYWLNHFLYNDPQKFEIIIQDYVLHKSENIREAAQNAIIRAVRRKLLDIEIQEKFAEIFLALFQTSQTQVLNRPETKQTNENARHAVPITVTKGIIRDSTATLLWVLRQFITASTLLKVTPVALWAWMRKHRTSPIFVSVISSFIVALAILLALVINEQLRGTWQREPMLFAGPVSVTWVKEDPNFIYVITPRGPEVGSSATLWRENKAKGVWEILSHNLTSASINSFAAIKSRDKIRLYISIWGKGIIRSDDNGKTWRPINSGLHSYAIVKIVRDEKDHNILYAASADSRGVFESRDGGDTWQDISGDELFGRSVATMIYTDYGGGALIVSTTDAQIMARKTHESVWKTLWVVAKNGVATSLSPEPIKKQVIYAGTVIGDLLISKDGGGTWYQIGKPPGVFNINSIRAVPGQPQKAFLDTYGVGGYIIWQTNDFGQTWKPIVDDQFTREPVNLYIHEQQPDILYAFGAPGFFETHNNGGSWTYHNIGSPIATVHRVAISPIANGPTYLAVGGGVFSGDSQSPSINWQRGHGLGALFVRDLVADLENRDRAFASVYLPNKWSVFFTQDGGKNWQATTPPTRIPEKFLNDAIKLGIARLNGLEILYVGTNGCGVIYTVNRGVTWDTSGHEDCNLGAEVPKSVIDLAITPQSANMLYVAADSTRVYVSTDRGKNWQANKLPLTNEIIEIVVDPIIEDRVYVTAGADGFWRSDDRARTWKKYSVGLEEKSLEKLIAIPGVSETLYVSTSNGEIWKTINGGQTWASAKENLTTNSITDLAYDLQKQELILSTGQDGTYRLKPGSLFNFLNRKEVAS